MIAALLGLSLPIVAAWLALRAAGLRSPRDTPVLTAVLSFALGIGASSFSTLLLVTQGVAIGRGFVIIDAVLWSAVILLCGFRLRRGKLLAASGALDAPPADQRRDVVGILVRVAFAAVATAGIATLFMEYVRSPHGQWDAWAIWNQKARFLFRGGREWTAMMEVGWSNPGHPMLVSTAVARLWAYAAREATAIPAVLAALFGAAVVAGVIGALDPRRSRAWIAGALVLAPTTFLRQVAAQTADLPMSLYVLLTIVLLRTVAAGASTRSEERSSLILAGLMVGTAAWTKNEGLVLFALTTLLIFWWAASGRQISRLTWWLAASAPLVLVVAWYKLAIAPVAPEYMPQSEGVGSLVARFTDPMRPLLILSSAWHFWLAWGGRYAGGVLPAVTLAAGAASFARAGRPVRGLLLTLSLMFVSYFAVWLVAPFDATWLISTTFDRLLIQLWPALVVIAFSLADPELPATSNR